MKRHVALLLACILQARLGRSYEDPIYDGEKYLMSSKNTGSDYYLGCGDDMKCSMVSLVNAHEYDGWTVKHISDVTYQFLIRDGSWALDVVGSTTQAFGNTEGNPIFANADINSYTSLRAQLWVLTSQSDGTYRLDNVWKNPGALDVDQGVTPFVNENVGSGFNGQYWFFRSVFPQTTTTFVSTSIVTVNSYASSTVTVTTTMCPATRAYVNGKPLQKRDNTGSAVLDLTTTIVTNVVTSTTTVSTKTSVITTTEVVTSCQPVTETQTKVSISKSVATVTIAGAGAGLTAGAPGITVTNNQPDTTPTTTVKQGAGNVFQPCTGLGLLFMGMASLVPSIMFC